jgi:hypothetical protein
MTDTSDPRNLARHATMRRIRTADLPARYMRQRRQAAARNGYRGPLTRADLARQAAR